MSEDTERTEWTCQECGHVEWRKRCSHCWRPEDPTEDWTPPESQRVGGRVYRKQTRFDA